MHEAGALTWRDVVERHHSTLVYELSERLDSDLKDAVSRAIAAERLHAGDQLARTREEVSRTQAESLNQALRRMRQANGDQQILQALVENLRQGEGGRLKHDAGDAAGDKDDGRVEGSA